MSNIDREIPLMTRRQALWLPVGLVLLAADLAACKKPDTPPPTVTGDVTTSTKVTVEIGEEITREYYCGSVLSLSGFVELKDAYRKGFAGNFIGPMSKVKIATFGSGLVGINPEDFRAIFTPFTQPEEVKSEVDIPADFKGMIYSYNFNRGKIDETRYLSEDESDNGMTTLYALAKGESAGAPSLFMKKAWALMGEDQNSLAQLIGSRTIHLAQGSVSRGTIGIIWEGRKIQTNLLK